MNLDILLREVRLLKERQIALQELLDEKYVAVEAELKTNGVDKYSVGKGKEGITARMKKTTRYQVTDADGLLEAVADPVKFARVVLLTTTVTKKMIQGMEQAGLTAGPFFKPKLSKPYLEIVVGKEGVVADRVKAAHQEYYVEVERLTEEFKSTLFEPGCKAFLNAGVFPKTPVEKLEQKMEEEGSC